MSEKEPPAAAPAERTESRRRRPRGRGKKQQGVAPAGAPVTPAREKRRALASPERPKKRRKENPPWLVPIVVFFTLVAVGILALIASRAGR